MGNRLNQLKEELDAVPVPADTTQQFLFNNLKGVGRSIAFMGTMKRVDGTERGAVASASRTLDMSVASLGATHPAIVIVRKMITILKARLDGKPEPSDLAKPVIIPRPHHEP